MALFVPAGFVAAGLLPWLASAISGMFFAIMGFFTSFLIKKVAIVLAVVALVILITTAFFAAIVTLISTVAPVLPPYVAMAAGWVLPTQTPVLIGVLFSARLLRWAYEWHVKVVQWKLY